MHQMPAASDRRPVLAAHVKCMTDFERSPISVIFSEYGHPRGMCRLTRNALERDPLSQLLERVEENTLGSRSTRCDLS
jgi:hypothetical protein